jgi:valyl-tRNA synthetase
VLMPCPKCKKESQFSTPQYDLDPAQPAARMVSERFEYGRNFCNKLWNAARFAIMNLEGYMPGKIEESDLRLEDRWVLSRLSRVTEEVTTLLGRYQFDKATQAIRDFTWNEFCDWYLEMIKPRLRSEEGEEGVDDGAVGSEKASAQRILVGVLDGLVRLLQPFTPFICEELWQRLNEVAPERGLFEPEEATPSVMIASWPELAASLQDDGLEERFGRLQETVVAVRNIRAVYGIGPNVPVKLFMKCEPGVAEELQVCSDQFDNLARTVLEAAGAEVDRPAASASFNLKDADGFVPLEGLVDVAAELDRQKKEADKLRGFIKGHSGKLKNEKFVQNAPEKVVAEVRETLAGLEKQLESVEAVIAQLSAG